MRGDGEQVAKFSLKYRLLRKTMRLIGFKKQMTGTADEIT